MNAVRCPPPAPQAVAMARWVARHGGEIIFVADTGDVPDGAPWSASPQLLPLAVNYVARQIYVDVDQDDDWSPAGHLLGDLVHEIGHVFATRHAPRTKAGDEFPWLGWEYAFARQHRVVQSWYYASKYYAFFDGSEFHNLTSVERTALLRERLRYAQRTRRVSPSGRALSVRQPLRKRPTS